MVRHDDPVGKAFFVLRLVPAMDVQSGLSVPLEKQGVYSSDCSLEGRETMGLYSHITHSVLAVLPLVRMEAPGIPFHPSTAMHQAAKGTRSFIYSGRNRNN